MTPIFALGLPGLPELLLIFVIVFVLFGAKRLPELAKALGGSMKEFRKARDEFEREIYRGTEHADHARVAGPAQPARETPVKPD